MPQDGACGAPKERLNCVRDFDLVEIFVYNSNGHVSGNTQIADISRYVPGSAAAFPHGPL
jgi:hypothetical protein